MSLTHVAAAIAGIAVSIFGGTVALVLLCLHFPPDIKNLDE